MQESIKLAQKILSVLEHENPRDAIDGIKIAMILLPINIGEETSRTQGEAAPVHEESFSGVR